MSLLRWMVKVLGLARQSQAQHMATRAASRLQEMQRRLRRDMVLLDRLKRKAESLLERVALISETTVEDLEDGERKLRAAEKAMDALRAEHQVDADVVIPALVSRMKLVEEKNNADIAIANHRRAAATPRSGELT